MQKPFKRKKKLEKIVISVLSAALLVFLLNYYQKEVKSFFYSISSPIQKKMWRAGDRVANFFETIYEIKNLKRENEELKAKMREVLAENAVLAELKKENKILREALDAGLEKDFKLIISQVIARQVFQDSLIIDKGSKDGIKEYLPVVTQQKILLGTISAVYENYSEVMLITNSRSSFSGKISRSGEGEIEQTEISGLVRGKGNLNLSFELLPKDKEIREKDFVVTSALGGTFPQGLLVGEINSIKRSDTEPFQQAEISPLFDIKELDILLIIIEF